LGAVGAGLAPARLLFASPTVETADISSAPSRASRLDLDKEPSKGYLDGMRSVDLKTLRKELSEYVRLAAHGETVLITDGERVVAELVPPRESRTPLLSDASLAEAVRAGLITPALPPSGQPPPKKPAASLKEILGELEADRRDRFL
jgi:antitoxin (DNA-binding transcriptional repressor) of toxin-antitoxin stability system